MDADSDPRQLAFDLFRHVTSLRRGEPDQDELVDG
jgi:hypothetical protein